MLYPIDIPLWSRDESEQFFCKAFKEVGIDIHDNALALMAGFCGGHPALAHEIGNAVFQIDDDGSIDKPDAYEGVLNAAEIVGRKYLEPQVYRTIRAIGASSGKEGLRFLRRMQRLEVIVSDPEMGRGAHRFQTPCICFSIEAGCQRHHG